MEMRYLLLLGAVGCGSVDAKQQDAAIDGPVDMMPDVAIDAPLGPCTPDMPFGNPTVVQTISSPEDDFSFRPSSDGLSAIVGRNTASGPRLHLATRASTSASFGTPNALTGAVNSGGGSNRGQLSSDGLKVFFESDRTGNFEVLVATRSAPGTDFGTPTTIASLSTVSVEGQPFLATSGRLYFARLSGTAEIMVAPPSGATFGTPSVLSGFTGTGYPAVTEDELEIFVTKGGTVYHATRASTAVPFGTQAALAHLSGQTVTEPTFVSADHCELYFSADRPIGAVGGRDIWVAKRR